MSREIKFRGLRENGKWEYGYLMNKCYDDKVYIAYFQDKEREVLPNTVGQYTGLKDKNGVEIYEGDRITDGHYTYTIKFGNIGYDGSHNGLTGFYLEEEANVDYNDETFLELNYYFNYKEFEVIGNIHEGVDKDGRV